MAARDTLNNVFAFFFPSYAAQYPVKQKTSKYSKNIFSNYPIIKISEQVEVQVI